MLTIVCILFIIFACMLFIISVTSKQLMDTFTQFPADMLQMCNDHSVDDNSVDDNSVDDNKKITPYTNMAKRLKMLRRRWRRQRMRRNKVPALSKRKNKKSCKLPDRSDNIEVDMIKPKTSDKIQLKSHLNVNGVLDVNALKINNFSILRYDETNDSFIFG